MTWLSKNIATQGALDAFNIDIPSGPEGDSVHDYLEQVSGEHISNIITLTGTGATSVNIFQLTGTVEILQLHGAVLTADTLTDMTAVHWELFADAAAVDITKNDGDLSAMAVGTFFAKTGAASVTMGINDNVAAAMIEPAAGPKAFAPFIITQMTGTATYLRLTYTTTDDPIVATLGMSVRYRPHTAAGVSGTLTAV